MPDVYSDFVGTPHAPLESWSKAPFSQLRVTLGLGITIHNSEDKCYKNSKNIFVCLGLICCSYLHPDIFTDSTNFDTAFNLTKNVCDAAALGKAHHLLRLFQLRRLKVRMLDFFLWKLQCSWGTSDVLEDVVMHT